MGKRTPPLFEDEKTDPGIRAVPQELLEDEITDPNIRVADPTGTVVDLGVIDDYLTDPSITEIMVNDTRNIMLEKQGRMMQANARIETDVELTRISREVLKLTDRPFNFDHPALDLALPDGSRLHMIGPPLVKSGICLTIRKFPKRYSMQQLQQLGTMDERMGIFLQKCVQGRISMLISGGTGSGKTTVLTAFAGSIGKDERVVTIEDTPELKLSLPNLVQMYTKPKLGEAAAITQRELITNALRMRPDRIIVGECRQGEALDMLQAMNTGHDGSLSTIHANTPRDALARLETLSLLAGVENLTQVAIRRQIASAIQLVIQVERLKGGKRKITKICEITGMEGDIITLQDLFHYEPQDEEAQKYAASGTGAAKAVTAEKFICDGFVPSFIEKLNRSGITFPPRFFG